MKGADEPDPATPPKFSSKMLYNELVSERIFRSLPAPLCHVLVAACTSNPPGVEQRLARVLFRLTNELLAFGDKPQQVESPFAGHNAYRLNSLSRNSWAL